MNSEDYWREAVESSLEEAGIAAEPEQVKQVAGDMKISHDMFDTAFGYDVASMNLAQQRKSELEEVKASLETERAKRGCYECRGRGGWEESYGTFSSWRTCDACKGTGKV